MTKRRSPWLIAATALTYLFLYAPIVVLVVFSFNASRLNITWAGPVTGFSADFPDPQTSLVTASPCGPFHWYCRLFNNRELTQAAGNTLLIAFTSATLSTIIGTMAALALSRYRFPGRNTAEGTIYLPLVIPEIVMGISLLVLYSTVFRWLNEALGLAGADRLALGIGTVIVSHVVFSVSFVTLVVRARLQGFDKSLEEAAADLGANEWVTFWRVTLPLIAPGVLAGGLLAFTLSLDDFIITFFTTGPGATTLPIYVYGLLRRITTPELNALSTIWLMLVLGALFLSRQLERQEA